MLRISRSTSLSPFSQLHVGSTFTLKTGLVLHFPCAVKFVDPSLPLFFPPQPDKNRTEGGRRLYFALARETSTSSSSVAAATNEDGRGRSESSLRLTIWYANYLSMLMLQNGILVLVLERIVFVVFCLLCVFESLYMLYYFCNGVFMGEGSELSSSPHGKFAFVRVQIPMDAASVQIISRDNFIETLLAASVPFELFCARSLCYSLFCVYCFIYTSCILPISPNNYGVIAFLCYF